MGPGGGWGLRPADRPHGVGFDGDRGPGMAHAAGRGRPRREWALPRHPSGTRTLRSRPAAHANHPEDRDHHRTIRRSARCRKCRRRPAPGPDGGADLSGPLAPRPARGMVARPSPNPCGRCHGARPRLLRGQRDRAHHAPGHRQRIGLPLHRFQRRGPRFRGPPPVHAPLHAAAQRQSRALQPDPGRGVPLRPSIPPARSNEGTNWANGPPTTITTDPTPPRRATHPPAASPPPQTTSHPHTASAPPPPTGGRWADPDTALPRSCRTGAVGS